MSFRARIAASVALTGAALLCSAEPAAAQFYYRNTGGWGGRMTSNYGYGVPNGYYNPWGWGNSGWGGGDPYGGSIYGSVAEFQSRHPLPVVNEGLVAIYPGTTLYVAGDIADGRLVNMRAIDEPQEPSRVLKLHMWQKEGKPDTFLQVTNYFREDIKFRAGMMLPSGDDVYATSSCLVLSNGRHVFEHWPHAIFQLLLDEFHVVDTSSDKAVCK